MFGWGKASHKIDDYIPVVRGMLQTVMDKNPNLCARGPDAFLRALSRYIHNSRTIPQDLKAMLEQESNLLKFVGIDRIWKEVRIAVDHPELKAYAHFVAQIVFNNPEFKEACASNDTDTQIEILLEKIRRILFLIFNGCVSSFTAPISQSALSNKLILVWRQGDVFSEVCAYEDDAERSYFAMTSREQDRVFNPHGVALAEQEEANAEAFAGFFEKHGLNKKIENKLSSKLSSWLSRKKRKERKERKTRRNRRSTRKH